MKPAQLLSLYIYISEECCNRNPQASMVWHKLITLSSHGDPPDLHVIHLIRNWSTPDREPVCVNTQQLTAVLHIVVCLVINMTDVQKHDGWRGVRSLEHCRHFSLVVVIVLAMIWEITSSLCPGTVCRATTPQQTCFCVFGFSHVVFEVLDLCLGGLDLSF